MKRTIDPAWRTFPHVIEFRKGPSWRYGVIASNEPHPAAAWTRFAFCAPGTLAPGGGLTPAGREAVLRGVIASAAASTDRLCVVWGEHDCTFVLADCTTVEGRTPPTGEPIEPENYLNTPADTVTCRYVEMPTGCATTHICIVTLTRRRVELATGGPMVLGSWNDGVPPGREDPIEAMLGDDGIVRMPDTFRGQRVSGWDDGGRILGPIQPDGRASFVVEPWPEQVFEACRRLAGRELPEDVLAAVWRGVDPIRWGIIQGSVSLAA